jgi:hypothetical protein
MDVCGEVRRARRCGNTRCGVLDGQLSVAEVARAFDLADDPQIYRSVARAEAEAVATHILTTDLAYRGNIMSPTRAAELWQQFMALFDQQDVHLLTNAAADLQSWTPATSATFDLGILVIGASKGGCLWVEDDD